MIQCVVCIRPFSDSVPVRADQKEGKLTALSAPGAMNLDDKAAVEAALRLREAGGGTVAVLCAGPEKAEEILREALAMGCDEAVRAEVPFPDAAFAGAAASALKAALENRSWNLILMGGQAIDSDVAQTPALLAEALGIPQLTQAQRLSMRGGQVRAQCPFDGREVLLEAPLPCLATVTDKLAAPRYATFAGIREAYGKPLLLLEDKGEAAGSGVLRVKTVMNRQRGRKGKILRGPSPQAAADQLLSFIRGEGLL